jgi:hypothetical protein
MSPPIEIDRSQNLLVVVRFHRGPTDGELVKARLWTDQMQRMKSRSS